MGAVGVTARAVAEAAPELSLLQWRVLVVLAGSPDGRTVSEVADRIGSRLPATSRLLGRLRRRGLVEAHGGTIHVEERGDLGAVFVVRLPGQPSA